MIKQMRSSMSWVRGLKKVIIKTLGTLGNFQELISIELYGQKK